jgi:hypothetical protein
VGAEGGRAITQGLELMITSASTLLSRKSFVSIPG